MSMFSNLAAKFGFRDPVQYDRHVRSQGGYVPERLRALPETDQGWQERYNWLWDWYSGMPYGHGDVKYLRLFKSVDTSGETIAMAERLNRDAQFVVDTDVHALAGGRWSLEPSRGTGAGLLRAGESVWRRSDLQSHRASWIRSTCSMGDTFLEAIRDAEGRSRIVAYDPRHCQARYSADGLTLIELTVRIPYLDLEGVPRVYERIVTADGIEAVELTESGERAPLLSESGDHGLGVAPVVHLRCQPVVGIPEHSLWSGHGLDRYIAAMDSMLAQIRAIAHRYAHPHMVVKGLRLTDTLGDGGGVEQLGRRYEIPADTDIEYLEAGMGAIAPLWETLRDYGDSVRATIPEFTLAGSGANTSGRALEFRADQFRRKMSDLATRTHDPVALVTQYAVEMERDRAHDPGRRMYRIGSPPPLPIDQAARLSMVQQAFGAGLLKREDAVRHMQALGLVDEEQDAAAYADALEPETNAAPNVDTSGAPE